VLYGTDMSAIEVPDMSAIEGTDMSAIEGTVRLNTEDVGTIEFSNL